MVSPRYMVLAAMPGCGPDQRVSGASGVFSRLAALCVAGWMCAAPAHAAFTLEELMSGSNEIVVGNSESIWREIFGNYDYNVDQQTGQGQSDIVGTATDPGFYTAYDDGGTAGSTGDDYIAFRIRTNDQNGNKDYYGGYLWVGIDADGDNDIDAYINYTASNSSTTVSIYGPGAGLNNSPSTSTVTAPNNTAAYVWTNPTGYDQSNYRAVDTLIDGGTTTNAGSPDDTSVDWYVTFQLPFASLINFLNDEGEMGVGNTISGVDDTTPLRFIVASSTQANSLNQDIGGIDGNDPNYDPNLTWDQQPGSPLSQPFNGTGLVPEPSSSLLLILGGLGLLLRRRRA